jgi:hypothetical protein
MTTRPTIVIPGSILAEDRVSKEVKPEHMDLRHRIERLVDEIFEGHEEYLGVTPD